ncbi:MAG: hypothetical protein H6835_09130 [Planctomycetes bacterium]|nr:hypothetical protein [Planctomycetota bacterium]
MRSNPCWLLAGVLVACGSESAPSSPKGVQSTPAARAPAAQPATGTAPERSNAAAAEQRQDAAPLEASPEAIATARRIVADAATAGPVQQAKAPAALRALGTAALPAVTEALRADDVTSRRIAALTLLQWSDDLHRDGGAGAVVAALTAAREDADPAVRAAVDHALRRATGDTSELDRSRAADEAARRLDR